MKYLKQFKGYDDMKEISYEEALRTVLGSYRDNAEVRSWLTDINAVPWKNKAIPCRFSIIHVKGK